MSSRSKNNKHNRASPRIGNNKKGPGRKHVQGSRKAKECERDLEPI
jgi:hypothetical protein